MKRNTSDPSPSQRIDFLVRLIVALVAGVVLGTVVTLVGLPTLQANLLKVVIGFMLLIVITALLAFWVVMRKEKVLQRLFGVGDVDVKELHKTAQLLISSVVAKDFEESKTHLSGLLRRGLAWYSWLGFRRWVIVVIQALFVSFGGLLGTVLLYNQNKLMLQQNELLLQQNKRLDQQTYLQEAERRGSLIFLMGNILDVMDDELRRDVGMPGVRDLSPQLIGRISALSNSLRPYKYLRNDSLLLREVSPERGNLLLSIVGSELDKGTLRRIYKLSDFSSADLRNAVLSGEYLCGINLANADLTGATLDEVDLSESNLSGAELNDAVAPRANLRGSRFRQAQMRNVNLASANLSQSNFSGANLHNANLSSADLRSTHLSTANLQKANLSSTILGKTVFEGAAMDSVTVFEFDWLGLLENLGKDSLRGTHYLKTNYYTDSVQTTFGYEYQLLKRRKE